MDIQTLTARCADRRHSMAAGIRRTIRSAVDRGRGRLSRAGKTRRGENALILQSKLRALSGGAWVRRGMTDSPDEAEKRLLVSILEGVERLEFRCGRLANPPASRTSPCEILPRGCYGLGAAGVGAGYGAGGGADGNLLADESADIASRTGCCRHRSPMIVLAGARTGGYDYALPDYRGLHRCHYLISQRAGRRQATDQSSQFPKPPKAHLRKHVDRCLTVPAAAASSSGRRVATWGAHSRVAPTWIGADSR